MFLKTFVGGALCVGGLVAGAAEGAVTGSLLGSDAEFLALGLEETFVAEARNVSSLVSEQNSDRELGLGPVTNQAGAFDQEDIVWQAGAVYDYTLTLSGTTLTWDLPLDGVGVETLAWTDAGFADTAGIAIRVAGLNDDNVGAAAVSTVNGGSVTGTNSLQRSSGAGYILLSGPELSGDFELAGTLLFTFDGNTVGSRPAVQIKGIVPAPGSAALVGVAGLAAVRRRR